MDGRSLSLARGRMLLLAAALMWSTSGMLGKLIDLPGPTMACWRALFAAAVLVPMLRPTMITFRPAMLGMIACFATMNVCYVTAITKTTAANAIFLQYTASAWMFLASVFLLREPMERRNLFSLIVAMLGISIIVISSWQKETLGVVLGLVSGMAYAGVAVCLRVLRTEHPFWLTVLNHFVSGLVVLPVVWLEPAWGLQTIAPWQWVGLAVYGGLQMAVPYVLFSRALSVVTPQEAGLITLFEPVLNPVLTWLAVGEVPTLGTFVGGAIILSGVAARYLGRGGIAR